MDANRPAHGVVPHRDQVRVVDRLGKGHQLHVLHRHGEHTVDEDLVVDQTGHQRPPVVLVFLLLPVTPGDGVVGKAGVHVLVDNGALGGLRHTDRGFHNLHGAALHNRQAVAVQDRLPVLVGHVDRVPVSVQHILHHSLPCDGVLLLHLPGVLGVEQHVKSFPVAVVADDLRLPANAGHILGIAVRLDGSLQQISLGVVGLAVGIELPVFPESLGLIAKMLHRVPAHEKNIGLRLHPGIVGIAEHHVDAVHQLHLDLTPVGTESAAVGQGVRVIEEVCAVVACLGPVEQGFPDPVLHLEFLPEVSHLRVGEGGGVMTGVRLIAAVIVGQRVEAQRHAGGGQGSDEKRRHPLQDVKGGLVQLPHGRGIRQTDPLVPDEELGVRVHQSVLVRNQGIIIHPPVFVELPGQGHIIPFQWLSLTFGANRWPPVAGHRRPPRRSC